MCHINSLYFLRIVFVCSLKRNNDSFNVKKIEKKEKYGVAAIFLLVQMDPFDILALYMKS